MTKEFDAKHKNLGLNSPTTYQNYTFDLPDIMIIDWFSLEKTVRLNKVFSFKKKKLLNLGKKIKIYCFL